MAEHGTTVPEPLYLVMQQAMLHAGTYTPCRTLGTQGKTVTVAVFKGIHLLFDNIGNLTDGALEQFGLFQQGQAHLAVAIGMHNIAQHGFQVLPGRRRLRKDVVHAPDGLYCLCHDLLIIPV